jgi:hypothetical protein
LTSKALSWYFDRLTLIRPSPKTLELIRNNSLRQPQSDSIPIQLLAVVRHERDRSLGSFSNGTVLEPFTAAYVLFLAVLRPGGSGPFAPLAASFPRGGGVKSVVKTAGSVSGQAFRRAERNGLLIQGL